MSFVEITSEKQKEIHQIVRNLIPVLQYTPMVIEDAVYNMVSYGVPTDKVSEIIIECHSKETLNGYNGTDFEFPYKVLHNVLTMLRTAVSGKESISSQLTRFKINDSKRHLIPEVKKMNRAERRRRGL